MNVLAEAPWVPLLSLASVGIAFALVFAWGRSGRWTTRILAGVVSVLVAILVVETGLWLLWREERRAVQRRWIHVSFMESDDALGYRPTRGARFSPKEGVDYTIGTYGERLTPDAPRGAIPVVVLGGSFSFGEGMSDDQSYPYRLGEKLGEGFRVLNFGFLGWGPHQVLSLVGTRAFDEALVDGPPGCAIYLVIEDHLSRVAGKAFWDPHGPRFVSRNGELVRDGNFDDPWRPEDGLLAGSHLYQRVFPVVTGSAGGPTAEDLQLFAAVTKQIADRLSARNPDIELHALWWNDFTDLSPGIAAALRDAGFSVHDILEFAFANEMDPKYSHFEGYGSTSGGRFQLDDGHPSAWMHEMLADLAAEFDCGGGGDRTTEG